MSQRSDPRARALEVCLQGLLADVGPEQVLEAYPRQADALRPLIWTALAVRSHARATQVPAQAQEKSLAGFIQISQRMTPRNERRWPARLVRLILLLLFLAAVVVSVAWAAETLSRPALPGSLLHPLKLACEQIRLSLTRHPIRRLALELAYDQKRLAETRTLIQNSLTAEVTVVGSLHQGQGAAQWLVEEFRIQIPTNARFMGDFEPGYAIIVQGALLPDGSILAKSLRMREYTLTGVIQSITADQMQFIGLPIQLSPQTLIMGIPADGSLAQVILRRSMDGQFVARLVEILP